MKVTVIKGGPGSGNKGHAGRPGLVGGSGPGKGPRGDYDRPKYLGMDMQARRAAWEGLSVAERDRQADARNSIRTRIDKVLGFAGDRPPLTDGNVGKAIDDRLSSMKELVTPDALKSISKVTHDYDKALENMGISAEDRHKLALDAADILAVQENESMGRQLGDHGINHIQGDINFALQMAEAHPIPTTDADRAEIMTACIYHDAGYLTPPSHDFLDEGHPRWSMQYYDANVRPTMDKILGEDVSGDISHIIRTHDTADIDWDNDFVGSAVRVADNVSIFQKEKLPPLFRYVDGNTEILEQLAENTIDLSTAKTRMAANIDATSFSSQVKSEMKRGVREIGAATPKFTLGMLGGEVAKFSWKNDHMLVHLRQAPQSTLHQKVLDLGQHQFGKFAKAYHYDPAKFMEDLNFTFTNPTSGKPLLESVII